MTVETVISLKNTSNIIINDFERDSRNLFFYFRSGADVKKGDPVYKDIKNFCNNFNIKIFRLAKCFVIYKNPSSFPHSCL